MKVYYLEDKGWRGSVDDTMFWSAGIILVLAVSQVPAEIIKPVYLNKAKIQAENGAGGSSRIVSGWEAVDGQFPHQVSLRMVNAVGGVTGCGGSIVHRNWVITAAHCTGGQVTTVVRAGLIALSRPQYIQETREWYIPPTYNIFNPQVQPDDISIVKLPISLTYSNLIQPIRIQPRADAHRNYAGLVGTASGWGQTWTNGPQPEIMNWVYLRPIANFDCQMIYGTALITQNTICAGPFNVTSQSICQGDSGGPLTVEGADGKLDLIGVSSFVPDPAGPFGCHSGYAGGFCRPGPFHDWFQQVTGIDFENFTEEPPTEPPTEAPTTTPAPTTTSAPTTTEPPTDVTNPEPEESEEEDSSSSEEDPDLAELLKKLIVKVKVKVKINDKVKRKLKLKTEDKF